MRNLILGTFITLCMLPLCHADEVNINTADAPTLAAELKGIGLAKARAIVEHRENNGDFTNADELALVKGIGLRTVDINRDNIKVQKPEEKN